MNRRNATLGVAAAGVLAGAVGLGVLAAPAGAGQAPNLPATTPQALVQSVLSTKQTPAFAGTVDVQNNLGLPAILPNLPQLSATNSQIGIWADGAGHGRISLPSKTGEQTIVDDGTTLYQWNSANRSVTETPQATATGKAGASKHANGSPAGLADPASAARELVSTMQSHSTVSVEGTEMVAGRPVYDLVLTPKPTERTLVRQVRIAVDAQQHLPLQVSVLADGTANPAVQIGFSNINFGAQDPALFHFTPPAGSTVTQKSANDQSSSAIGSLAGTHPTVVGTGWDSVVIATLPQAGAGTQGSRSASIDPLSLARQFGTPVTGTWGSGWVVSTDVGTALITSDGRLAVGLVPQQVLTQALSGSR